jgi:hypothetical protein
MMTDSMELRTSQWFSKLQPNAVGKMVNNLSPRDRGPEV